MKTQGHTGASSVCTKKDCVFFVPRLPNDCALLDIPPTWDLSITGRTDVYMRFCF